jgi:hypothetical protein
VLRLGIPDLLVDHASPDQSKQSLGLTPPQMASRIVERFGVGNFANRASSEARTSDDRLSPIGA